MKRQPTKRTTALRQVSVLLGALVAGSIVAGCGAGAQPQAPSLTSAAMLSGEQGREVRTRHQTETDRNQFGVPQAAWGEYPEVGLLEIPGWGYAAATLIGPNTVITGSALRPSWDAEAGKLPPNATFSVFITAPGDSSHVRIWNFRADQYQHVHARQSGDALIVRLEENVTERLPDLKPIQLSHRAPKAGEIVTRVGFGGLGCAASFDGSTKLQLRSIAEKNWEHIQPISFRCPQTIGAPLLGEKSRELLAISNYSLEFSEDRHASMDRLRIQVASRIHEWRATPARPATASRDTARGRRGYASVRAAVHAH